MIVIQTSDMKSTLDSPHIRGIPLVKKVALDEF